MFATGAEGWRSMRLGDCYLIVVWIFKEIISMNQMYNRAQQMILADKFKHNKQDFFKELTNLLNSYVDYDCVTVETMQGKQLNMVITVTLKDK